MASELTARQREILELWLSGLTYVELAERCGISPGTVNPHLRKIAQKLGTRRISREALAEHYSS